MHYDFTIQKHLDALIRRRVKFVVEKASMARLFKHGISDQLKRTLFETLKPESITKHDSQLDYDHWLQTIIEDNRWDEYARNGIEQDRWGYFAKLINIIIYEIASNRELVSEIDWQKIKWFLHVPLDSNVFFQMEHLDPSFPSTWILTGMTSSQYWTIQKRAREIALRYKIPTIWFDDAWSL